MISSSGRYWSVGITVAWAPFAERIAGKIYSGWHARLDFHDDGHCDNDPDAGRVSTDGRLFTRYPVRDGEIRTGLSAAIDTLLTDAKKLGIEMVPSASKRPGLFYEGDAKSAEHPPPEGWRNLLAAEAERVGFDSYETRTPSR